MKIQWEETCAKVVGWRKGDADPKKPMHLIAELRRDGGKSSIAVPLSKLPEQERKQCLTTFGKRHSDETVKDICSSLELPYFVHNHRTFFGEELRKHSLPNDAWQLREEFLRLQGNPKRILTFLSEWGRWVPLRNYVDMSDILNLQAAVRAALAETPQKWFATMGFPTMTDCRSLEFPYFTMLTDACEAAIRMTATIDILRGIKFRKCVRQDCKNPFPVKSKRKKVFCCQACAHLESVRRGRSTQRSA